MDISCTAINMLLFLLGGYLFKATTPNSQKASHMLFSKFLFCLIITLSLELKRKRGKEGDPPLTTSTISCPLAVMILVFCLWYQWPLITWDGFTLWRQHGRSLWFILILASFTTEDPPPPKWKPCLTFVTSSNNSLQLILWATVRPHWVLF